MSRQEDFKKAADDYVEGEPDGAQKIVGQVGFEFGAEYGYQYAIEKACKWLESMNGYVVCGQKANVENFRKAMEE